MDVEIEVVQKVTSDIVEAFGRLLPQLSKSAPPLDAEALTAIASAQANSVLVARVDGEILGTLTLVIFPIPTGIRAWIEDVVVDETARGKEYGGKRVGEALTIEALKIADAGRRADGRPDHQASPGSRRQALRAPRFRAARLPRLPLRPLLTGAYSAPDGLG